MTNDLFLKIISAILTVLVALITTFVIPWIKSRVETAKLDKVNYYVQMAVRCAEQIYTPEQWKEKKQYVTDYVTKLCNDNFHLTLTSEDIDVIIEGAVNLIKQR